MAPCICSARCCSYTAIDCDNISLLCKDKGEVCCCVMERCLDVNEESLGVGLTTNEDNNEICKISLYIVSCGLKTPDKCCASAGRCLCLKTASALPFDEQYLEKCVCAACGIQCKSSRRCPIISWEKQLETCTHLSYRLSLLYQIGAPECSCCGPAGTECPALDRPLKDYVAAPGVAKIER